MPKPRLLLIAPFYLPRNYGGAVQIYDGLLRRINAFDVAVLSEAQLDDAAKLADFDAGVPAERGYQIFRLPRLVFHLRSTNLRGVAALWEWPQYKAEVKRGFQKILKAYAPQVVICGATFSTGWILRHVPRNVATLTYIHGEELTMRRGGGYLDKKSAQEQLQAVRAADLNIVVSEYTAQTLQRVAAISAEKIAPLPNAVDTGRFHPPTDREALRERLGWAGHTLLLSIARLIPRKGIDQVLRALAEQHAAEKLPVDWLYCIGGNGPEKNKLIALAAQLGIADRVRFLGFIANAELANYYGAADLFALTNREIAGDTEGFGIVFLEANACGTAVLGGIAGGTAEAIAEGASGQRVDGDSVASIGVALAQLMNDAALREKLSAGGLQRVREQFDLTRRAEEFEALLLGQLKK